MSGAPYGWAPGKENYRPIRTLFDCALYKLNLQVTCWQCKHSAIIDAPGHWWRSECSGKDDRLAAFVSHLYCSRCFEKAGVKVREPKVETTTTAVTGALLDGPDHYTWKRIINRQRS